MGKLRLLYSASCMECEKSESCPDKKSKLRAMHPVCAGFKRKLTGELVRETDNRDSRFIEECFVGTGGGI